MKGETSMKTFETPFVDVKKFDVADILTTSGAADETEEPPPPLGGNIGDNCFS